MSVAGGVGRPRSEAPCKFYCIIRVVVRVPKVLLLCCCIGDICAERSVLLSPFSVSFMYDLLVLVGGGICMHLEEKSNESYTLAWACETRVT